MPEETLSSLAAQEPELSAEVLLFVAEQQKRDLVNALPTWEMVDQARKDGLARGFREGYETARAELYHRIFEGGDQVETS